MQKEKFTLSEPIKAHGETLHELSVRRPTTEECRAIKAFPYVLGDTGLPVAEPEAAAKYMAVCCAIPPSSVNQLDLHDFNNLAWQIIGFFVNSKPKTPAKESSESSEQPST